MAKNNPEIEYTKIQPLDPESILKKMNMDEKAAFFDFFYKNAINTRAEHQGIVIDSNPKMMHNNLPFYKTVGISKMGVLKSIGVISLFVGATFTGVVYIHSSINTVASELRADISKSNTEIKADMKDIGNSLKNDLSTIAISLQSNIERTEDKLNLEINQSESKLTTSIAQTESRIKEDLNSIKVDIKDYIDASTKK